MTCGAVGVPQGAIGVPLGCHRVPLGCHWGAIGVCSAHGFALPLVTMPGPSHRSPGAEEGRCHLPQRIVPPENLPGMHITWGGGHVRDPLVIIIVSHGGGCVCSHQQSHRHQIPPLLKSMSREALAWGAENSPSLFRACLSHKSFSHKSFTEPGLVCHRLAALVSCRTGRCTGGHTASETPPGEDWTPGGHWLRGSHSLTVCNVLRNPLPAASVRGWRDC